MRSIRRSLLGYLLLLLALALGGVGAFVDRFANAAITAREEAEAKRIELAFDARRQEAKAKLDGELVAETRALLKGVGPALGGLPGLRGVGRPGDARPKDGDNFLRAPKEDVQEYRHRATALVAASLAGGWVEIPAVAAVGRSPSAGWSGFQSPRAVARLPLADALRKAFVEDDDHPGYFQFHLVAYYPGHHGQTIGVVRPARVGHDLPIDLAALEQPNVDFYHDDIDIPGDGPCRRVVMTGGRPFWFVLPPPFSTFGGLFDPARRGPDFTVRVFAHYARPYSELTARLAAGQQHRDDQLARVRDESRTELARLRGRLGLIGGGTFLALVFGGWVIVARGLAPLRKLSDAVSRVSEKDFRLPVVGADLGRELAPIHARLTQTLDLLRRAFAREKEAVADISHELRTPIASLLATLDVALRKTRTPEQYRATLDDCRGIARQLGQLVERIMTLASLDAGNARTATVPTDAADVAADIAAVIRPLAEANGLTFASRVAAPVELDTDPDKLREVLMNLLHNAVEYNLPGGRVELAVRRDGAAAVFEVGDTGIGMPPEVREKIFERFYRADPSRHATGIHAGLGLAIVKEFVTRMNGSITVESSPGVGTTFRVSLPVAPAQPPAPAEKPRPDPRPRPTPAAAGS